MHIGGPRELLVPRAHLRLRALIRLHGAQHVDRHLVRGGDHGNCGGDRGDDRVPR